MMRAGAAWLPRRASHKKHAVTATAQQGGREAAQGGVGREHEPGATKGRRPSMPYTRGNDEGRLRAMSELADTFDAAFSKAVDLGNRIADKDKDADLWEIADGLLAGAIQYCRHWRQPCGDPRCQDCMPISTAQGRMAELSAGSSSWPPRASTSTPRWMRMPGAPEAPPWPVTRWRRPAPSRRYRRPPPGQVRAGRSLP